jgi:hypothetical protein
MRNNILLILLGALAIMTGCSKDTAIEVKEWDHFQDPIFKVSFMYPKDWYVVKEPSRVLLYTSIEVADKFFTRDPRKPDGVQIIIASERSDTMQDYVKYIEAYKTDQETAGFTIKGISDAKLEDLAAKQVTYAGAYDEQTKITATRIATLKDSTIYYIQYSGFNRTYEPGKFILDTVLATLILPKKIVVPKGIDISIPFTEVEKYSDNQLQLEYPANFGPTVLPKKGDMISGVKFTGAKDGMRLDCDITIDVLPAKKLTVEKVVEQNTKTIKPTLKKETTVSGEKAIFVNYSPAKNIDRRMYFMVKNDKIYRIILTYFAPLKKDFLPPFEKVVASIRIK